MPRSDALGGPPLASRAVLGGGADNPLVRAVGRLPVTVRTKLLVAFVGIAALLVAVAVLGLRVLGQSNSRAESLGTLQKRAATYQSVQTQAQQLRQLLAVRVASDPRISIMVGGRDPSVLGGKTWTLVDLAINASLSQLGPATNESRFGFVPPPGDERLLERIRSDYRTFSRLMDRITAADRAGATGKKSQPLLTAAINADTDLGFQTDQLAATTRTQTDRLIAQSGNSYTSSRNLFIGVGAASVLLALGLGFILSWSLAGPIQRTEARLAEIAAGDFSRHV